MSTAKKQAPEHRALALLERITVALEKQTESRVELDAQLADFMSKLERVYDSLLPAITVNRRPS